MGGPSFQVFFAVLYVLEKCSSADAPGDAERCSGGLRRIGIVLEQGSPRDAADWAREATCLQKCDKLGKGARNRFTYHFGRAR
eukprot:622331-Pyramimonas_sp.AAC.1